MTPPTAAEAREALNHLSSSLDAAGWMPKADEAAFAALRAFIASAEQVELRYETLRALFGEVCPSETELDAAIDAARAQPARYVAPVTDCEGCLTPDACAIRGQCAHYLREKSTQPAQGKEMT